jgi:hypothetical protein
VRVCAASGTPARTQLASQRLDGIATSNIRNRENRRCLGRR